MRNETLDPDKPVETKVTQTNESAADKGRAMAAQVKSSAPPMAKPTVIQEAPSAMDKGRAMAAQVKAPAPVVQSQQPAKPIEKEKYTYSTGAEERPINDATGIGLERTIPLAKPIYDERGTGQLRPVLPVTPTKPAAADLAEKKAIIADVKDKIDAGIATKEEKKSFMDMASELAKNWGVPILEVLQAGSFGYSGNTAKKLYETRLENVATKKEQDFMDKLNKDKLDYDAKTRTEDKAFETQQNKLQIDTQKQLQAQQLAAQERIAGLKNPAIATPLTVGQYVGVQ
jgi:hypothetical protein